VSLSEGTRELEEIKKILENGEYWNNLSIYEYNNALYSKLLNIRGAW
jgi:hypothetical protein